MTGVSVRPVLAASFLASARSSGSRRTVVRIHQSISSCHQYVTGGWNPAYVLLAQTCRSFGTAQICSAVRARLPGAPHHRRRQPLAIPHERTSIYDGRDEVFRLGDVDPVGES
jgi:hypothetical protein